MTSPPEGTRRAVPLRRLKTNRFKTLAQRNNDNARRRANYAIKRLPANAGLDPDVLTQAREAGLTWTQLADILATRRDISRDYMAGIPLGDRGKDLWAMRIQFGPDVPDELFYYKGDFG